MASYDTRLQEGDEDPDALVGVLERQLRTEPAPSDGELSSLRVRLSTLYLQKLDDPLSAAVHVEELLRQAEPEPAALELATALLQCRPLAPRIAEKLSTAYAHLDLPEREAEMLALELTIAKPERQGAVQRRLAVLRRERLGDPAGAMELLGPLVLQDPDDADLLARYVDAATAAEKIEDAVLVLSSAHDIAMGLSRARLGYSIGLLFLQEGELPRARAAFLSAVADNLKDEAVLLSARRLILLSREPEEPAELGPALEVLIAQEPDVALRQAAADRWLALGVFAPDELRAIPAWQALLDSPRAEEALGQLEPLYEKAGNRDGLAATLHLRALRTDDKVASRALSFRSAELRSESGGGDAAIEAWNFVLDTYGPSRDVHERLLPLLDAAGRYVELCERLEADAALSPPAEAAAALAKAGQVLLSRLSREDAALDSFERAVALDPTNTLARVFLERLVAEGTQRLRAAAALETASLAAGSDEGVLSALEARAELSSSPEEAIVAIARAVEIAARAPERATRGLLLSGRALVLAAASHPEDLPRWMERTREFAGVADDSATETSVMFEAAQVAAIDTAPRIALACAAIDLLVKDGRSPDALALSLRAFTTSPGSLALSERVDRLTAGREPPEARLTRYETTLETLTDANERREHRHAIAELARDGLADLPRAATEWRAILAEVPADERAQRGLVDAFRKTGDPSFLPAELEGVMATLDGAAQSVVLAARARALVAKGERDAALEVCRSLLASAESGDDALEAVATLAYEENEQDVYREALERLASSGRPSVRVQALERLGNYFEQTGNRRAAAESWKPAAMLSAGNPGGDERARDLYERVLAAAPDDCEAAERLLDLYVSQGRWVNVPGTYAILLRASADPGVTAKKLLLLEDRALSSGAVDDLVGMLDETLPYLGSTNEDVRLRLMLSKARVLAVKGRGSDAALAYRALIEAGGGDAALSAYEAFIRRLEPKEQHAEKRWLFEWRSARSEVSVDALIAWGHAEEAQGETLRAIRAHERAAELEPGRDEPFDALSRLRAAQGDFEGALRALRTVRQRATGARTSELDLRIARLLGEDLGRPEEALVSVAPLLSSSPPAAPALDLARRALERAEELDRTVELIERASNETQDPEVAAANLELLLEAPLDEASLGERREGWIVRLSALREADPDESLRVIGKGLAQNPRSPVLWEAFMARARSAKRADAVYEAFSRSIEHPSVDADTIELFGKRTIAFFDEWSSDSVEVQKTLETVLEHVPAARWALDRVKVLLFAGERWPALFRVYDRAIDGARDTNERAELLDEAALTARDLSRDAPRAIGYLEQLRALRPADAPLLSSLERLYEREGESAKLIALLSDHVAVATGVVKEELEQRIASLWLDLGDLGSAHALLESMLENGVRLADVAALLERILGVRPEHDVLESPKTPHSRAVALLVEHYQGLGQLPGVIRVRETELSFARGEQHQKRVVESLVGLYLEAGGGSDDAFIAAIPRVAAFGEQGDTLSRAATAKLLSLAEEAWKRRGASADSGSAQAAYWAVRKLEDSAIRGAEPDLAVRVLLHGAELPFVRVRQRELVRDAAIHLADRGGNPERAVLLFKGLFAEDPTDDVVTPHVDRFARLLLAVHEATERAELWESLGRKAVELGQLAHGRGFFTLSAELWETSGDASRAIAARRTSASLGSDVSLEVLGRLHRDRGEWRETAEALEWAFATASVDSTARVGSLLADAYLALGDRESAAARLEAVLDSVPGADDVRSRLSELYRADDAFRPLSELLIKGARVAEAKEQRLPMLREAADVLLTRLAEPARAIPLLEAATAIAGADGELALSLAFALDAAGRHADAVRVLRGQIALHGDLRPKSRALIHHRLAQVLLHMKNTRDALAELRTATEIDPSNPEMLYDLGRRALEENELSLAESTYRALLLSLHRAEPGQGPSRVDVYLDLSEVAARKNDPARAADYIESSFDVSLEGLEEALRLEKALSSRGRGDLVARSVERRLRAAKDPVMAALALRELLKLHEAQPDTTVELSSTIVRHGVEIEKQLAQAGNTDADIWATLADAARAGGGGDEARLEVLGRRIALLTTRAEDETDRAALSSLRDAAVSCERDLADADRAKHSYEAIVGRFPADWESWDALFRLSAVSGAPERLGALVAKAVKKSKSVEDRSRLRFAFAKTLLEDPKRGERATRVLEELLDEEPDHAAAAELLGDVLERDGRHAELVTLLESRFVAAQKAGRVPAPLALRLGAALLQSSAKERAVEVYDALVEDESTDALALEAVRERLEALSAPSLGNCLERLLLVKGATAEPGLSKRLVELRDEAGDAEGALRAAALGFEHDPGDVALRERLVQDHERHGRKDQARDVLALAVTARPDDRPLFLSWIDAAVHSGDRPGALAALDRALVATPSDTDLLRERARAKQESGRDEEALADLERAYELDPSFAFDVRTVLERLVQKDSRDRDRYVLGLVDVLVEQGEQDRAGTLLEDLLEERPEHVGGLERLAALKAASQDWPVAIAAYGRLLPLVGGDHELFARLTLEFAEACDRAGGSAQARAALERAYEHAPDRDDLRERLEAIYEAGGDRARLAELLLTSAARAEDAPRKASLFFRAAELLLKEDGDAERALAAIDSGRAAEPASTEGTLLFARALRALDRDQQALTELLALAERLRGKPGAGVSPVHLEIARIYLDADYLHEGFESLKQAFQLDPRNIDAAYLLGLVAIDVCDEATASRALRSVTAAREDKVTRETKAMAFYHLARLAQWKSDKRRAMTMAKSALTENPDCDVAKALLEALRQ